MQSQVYSMASADLSVMTDPDSLCAKCPLTSTVTSPLIYGDVGVDRDGPGR